MGTIYEMKQIKTEAEYQAALKEIESLMMADADTPEGEKLDVMVTLIEAYEAKHFPLLEEEEVKQQRRDEKNELYGPRKAYHLDKLKNETNKESV